MNIRRLGQAMSCRLLALFVLAVAQASSGGSVLAQVQAHTQTVSVFIVRHGESELALPELPLNADGRKRAELLAATLSGVKFTHLFASHTTRTRQMLEGIASAQGLPVVQLPAPGSLYEGMPVTDQTTRRAPIEPIAAALLKLPPGSVVLAALNSENIYAILNRLGVPLVIAGQSCAPGSLCVPCLDNTCFPRAFDHLWHLVLEAGRPVPLALVEMRYGTGWQAGRE